MTLHDELMLLVRAFNTLITTPPDQTAALAKAQADAKTATDALAAKTAEDTLTDAEQVELQTALNAASAVTPPTPTAVTAIVAAVPQG